MKKIIVASTNPVKLSATENAFKRVFPDEKFEFKGISASSGVPDQPMGEDETLKGAKNRAYNARKIESDADFYVGLEGGVNVENEEISASAWMFILAKDGKIGKARTGAFYLPRAIAKLVLEGKELGEANDIIFKRTNSKQSSGGVGLLTKEVITRAEFYESAIVLALIPFMNPTFYFDN